MGAQRSFSGFIAAVCGSTWVAFALNLPVYLSRAQNVHGKHPISSALAELVIVWFFTLGVFCLLWMMGRHALRLLGGLIILISAACTYYMIRFNVVIGFGVMSAIFTTDHDLTHEVMGLELAIWMLLIGVAPTWLWLSQSQEQLSWWRTRAPGRTLALLFLGLGASAIGFAQMERSLAVQSRQLASANTQDIKLSGAIAHAYVPSNWLAGVGMVLHRRAQDHWLNQTLTNPADRFDYQADQPWHGLHVVLVIGETTRFDRMGLFGHDRQTTPRLAQAPGVVAFAARSCDTSTRLSLACMFVRQEAITAGMDGMPDTISEHNVFSVFDRLGFDIDLYALQSEVWFYSRTHADVYKFREVITAQPQNYKQPVHDALLLNELRRSAERPNPQGQPRLTILHTKGSHFLYSKRYPRSFAAWQPECMNIEPACDKAQLLNAFDNSVLYTDHVLAEIIDLMRHQRAVMIYVADHGESIEDGQHFHATPRFIAPEDQRKVPMIFWASDSVRAQPGIAEKWQAMADRARRAQPMEVGHEHLFPSLLSCIGVSSNRGGITPATDLCAPTTHQAKAH